MTILKNTLILLFVMSLMACSDTASKINKTDKEVTIPAATHKVSHVIAPDSTVIAFLNWYRNNEDRLHQIQFLTGGLEDTSTFYSVDFKAAEKYLKELNSSGYLSGIFLDNLQRHFIQSSEYLKQHPQNDGPAPGFEADLIMKAQDYMDAWENLDAVKVIEKKVDGNKAFIKLLFVGNYKTKYYLSKSGQQWLIDNIENAYDEN
jgi:hypothetical protein